MLLAGQERLNCGRYYNSTLHTPQRCSKDFWLLSDYFFIPVGWDFLWIPFPKSKGESLEKMPYMNSGHVVVGKGKVAREEPLLCGTGEFSVEKGLLGV